MTASSSQADRDGGRVEHRPSRLIWIAAFGAFIVFLAVSTISFTVVTPVWIRVALVFLSLLALVALLELAQRRIELSAQDLFLVTNFRTTRIPRTDIAGVTGEKGAGVSLKLANGAWFHLPGVGESSQALTNSIRAWLKRTGPSG